MNTSSTSRSRRGRLDSDRVKECIDPIDFYQNELSRDFSPRKLEGWADGGLCPFHNDRRAGSFWVNLDNGAFKCFSCNASGGDIIAFRMRDDGITFPAALRFLADEYGVRA